MVSKQTSKCDLYLARGKLRRFTKAKVFVNEDLCPYFVDLFYKTRLRCKDLNLYTCYTFGGYPFVKVYQTSKPIKLLSENDITEN